MGTEMVTVILFGGLIILLTIGVPVVFALSSISILVAFILGGSNDLFIVATTTYRQITDYGLMSIPLFLLMGNFLLHSGISDRLFKALNQWLSGVRGGLAIVSVGVCVALAMCGGFGPGILMMGLIAVPAMLHHKYDKSLALGSVMAGGVLGEIIPPSIIMIIFAYISRVSIGRLFFGGAIPGFITAFMYVLYISTRCYFQPHLAPKTTQVTNWKEKMIALKEIILPAMLIFPFSSGPDPRPFDNCSTAASSIRCRTISCCTEHTGRSADILALFSSMASSFDITMKYIFKSIHNHFKTSLRYNSSGGLTIPFSSRKSTIIAARE